MTFEILRWYLLIGMAFIAIALSGKLELDSWPHAIITLLMYLLLWPIAFLLVIRKRR